MGYHWTLPFVYVDATSSVYNKDYEQEHLFPSGTLTRLDQNRICVFLLCLNCLRAKLRARCGDAAERKRARKRSESRSDHQERDHGARR